MNTADVRNMFLFVAQKIIEKKEFLTEVDSAIGDGDHGIGMSNGFLAVKVKLQSLDTDISVSEIVAAVGKAMLTNMGGASGALFGTLFSSAARTIYDSVACNEKDFANMMRAGLERVKNLGQAECGDKTMIDALEPAVIALEEHAGNGFKEMLEAARVAAWKGVEATKNMQAKFGRAKTLMERAIGFQDAGATSVALIFDAMVEFVANFNFEISCINPEII